MAGIDPNKPFVPLKFAVLTISDTRDLADDKSGATLSDRIKAAGHIVFERTIVRDDVEAIRARVKEWIDTPAVDVVVTTGGTGFTGRDVTPEAVEPLFEKKMEAFAVLFLMVSFRGCRQFYLHLLPARIARRLQGCLGRDSRLPARLSSRPLQLRRDHAAARRAPAPPQGEGRDGVRTAVSRVRRPLWCLSSRARAPSPSSPWRCRV